VFNKTALCYQGLSVAVNVMARISDTTGTLMAGSYLDKKCAIGLILGILCIHHVAIHCMFVPIIDVNLV
jgi:hypothetical protein